ncbi:hypothetical protein IQ06DRAFT_301518 [Phaeosphaeriaceae sp. SRC1lsM3a]|nr:hypothetical protein IQ06DRAFT_301518 [Stagonospora sp. SRC1lsM3a]
MDPREHIPVPRSTLFFLLAHIEDIDTNLQHLYRRVERLKYREYRRRYPRRRFFAQHDPRGYILGPAIRVPHPRPRPFFNNQMGVGSQDDPYAHVVQGSANMNTNMDMGGSLPPSRLHSCYRYRFHSPLPSRSRSPPSSSPSPFPSQIASPPRAGADSKRKRPSPTVYYRGGRPSWSSNSSKHGTPNVTRAPPERRDGRTEAEGSRGGGGEEKEES